MKNILLATGVPKVGEVFKHGHFSESLNANFKVISTAERREDVLPYLEKSGQTVDVLLITDALPGNMLLMELLPEIRMSFQGVRIVYITAAVTNRDERRLQNLSFLSMLKLYDIVTTPRVNPKIIYDALMHPATVENVAWLKRIMDKTEQSTEQKALDITIEDETDEAQQEEAGQVGFPNVFVFSSIKPGTGKSFISVNVAATIAEYGQPKENGEMPKIALIDGDLQNLSLGTLLQMDSDNKHNLQTVMEKIDTVLDKNGAPVDNPTRIRDVNAFIKQSFLPYAKNKNLEALVGSQLTMDQISGITARDFIYLLQAVKEEYDVIIIDSNSSLAHVSTLPLLAMANRCYYILNLDFNNIKNNSRYTADLKKMGILPRVRYILNENITPELAKKMNADESLIYTKEHVKEHGFDLVGSIPLIEKHVFLNRIYSGTPVALDDEPYTLESRLEIARIANQIWPIDKLPYLEEQYTRQQERDIAAAEANKKSKGFFGRSK